MMILWQESYNDHLQHWIESFLSAAALGVTIIFYLKEQKKKDEEKAEASRVAIKDALESKHRENTQRLDKQDRILTQIAIRQKLIPAHFHREKNGPLHAENIHAPNGEDDD